MKKILSFFMLALILVGCSAHAKNDDPKLKWYKSKEEAIAHGIKEEQINKEDIIGEARENGETFIIYKIESDKGLAVGVSYISKKDGQFTWYRPDQNIRIKTDSVENREKYSSQVSWESTSQSGKKFTIHIGINIDERPMIIKGNSQVSPVTDKKTGIFYYIEPAQ